MTTREQSKPGLNWFLFLATFSILVYTTFQFVILSWDYLHYPYELDRAEGCVLIYLSQWKQFGNYFFNLYDYPHSYAAYPPLFIWIALLVNRAVPSMLEAARVSSILFSLSTVFFIYFIIHKHSGRRLLSIIFALTFSSLLYFQIFAPLGRIDLAAIFFSLLGLFTFETYSEKKSKKRYFAFLFLILSFWTKQSSVIAPLSIFIYALFKKNERKNLVSYLCVYFIPLFLIIAGFNLYTHGEFFKHIFIYTGQRNIKLIRVADGYYIFLTQLPVFFGMSLLFIKEVLPLIKNKPVLIYVIYALINFFYLSSVGADHANLNYLLEPSAALILASALISLKWTFNIKNARSREILLSLLLCTQAVVCFLGVSDYQNAPFPRYFIGYHYKNAQETSRRLDQLVRDTEGEVLSTEFSLPIFHGKQIYFGCPPPIVEHRELKSLIFPKLLRDCQKGRFGLVIADDQLLKVPGMAECLVDNYDSLKEGDLSFASPYKIRNYYIFTLKPDKKTYGAQPLVRSAESSKT